MHICDTEGKRDWSYPERRHCNNQSGSWQQHKIMWKCELVTSEIIREFLESCIVPTRLDNWLQFYCITVELSKAKKKKRLKLESNKRKALVMYMESTIIADSHQKSWRPEGNRITHLKYWKKKKSTKKPIPSKTILLRHS